MIFGAVWAWIGVGQPARKEPITASAAGNRAFAFWSVREPFRGGEKLKNRFMSVSLSGIRMGKPSYDRCGRITWVGATKKLERALVS